MVVRYRLPAGSAPPLTDVIGHVVETGSTLRLRTKRGDVVVVSLDDVVTIKALGAAPVRTADIRSLEHAAALGWPGTEQEWMDGWLLRAGHGSTRRANSAVPLDISAASDMTAIIDWYAERDLPPLVAAPDRLIRIPPDVPTDAENVVMATDLGSYLADDAVALATTPDGEWLRLYERPVPVDVLTSVVDGEVVFASLDGAGVGRAALTTAPDGTRWVGLAAVHVVAQARRRGVARRLCNALLAWGAREGADRAYLQVVTDNTTGLRLFESMGFTEHHRSRYAQADALGES